MPYQVKFAAGFGLNITVLDTAKEALAALREAEEEKRDGIQVLELDGVKITLEELTTTAVQVKAGKRAARQSSTVIFEDRDLGELHR